MERLILFCVLVFFEASAQGRQGEAEQQECVRLWLQKKPDLLQRFQKDQLKWLCQKTDEWMQMAVTPGRPVSDVITPKQQEYLTKLQCQGADCIKEVKPKKQKQKQGPPGWVPSMIGGKKPTPDGQAPVAHSDALSDSDQFDTVDENSILNQEHSECGTRFWTAQTCKFLFNATTPEEVFPEEFNRPKIPSELRRKMQQRFENRKSKCERMKRLLASNNKSLDEIPNCDDDVILLTPKQFAERCKEILDYEKSQKGSIVTSAWNFVRKLVGGRGQTAVNSASYAYWLDKCRQARDRLQDKGMTFQTWITQLAQKFVPGKRRKRAGTNPSEALNVLHNDFADLLADNTADQRAKRKEYRMLTDDERKRYHAAINKLKTDKIDALSKYDLLVVYHTPQEASGAHWGPAFLPYHREFLKQYEIALRKEDPTLALPYWDTTLDEGLPTPRDSIIWTPDFLGTREGPVIEGPFANWTATQELSLVPGMHQLFRSVGTSPFGGLYKSSDIDFILGKEKYDDLTACVDPTFELVHGVVHMFVGGYMADIGISPNDPAFFMHHNFIDYLWEEFRQTKQTLQQRETDYPPEDKACINFHFADAQMKPFAIRNIDGLSNNYTKDIYYYQPRPRCSEAAPNCGSSYLFCDTKGARCLSKVQVNGNCTGFEGTDICYKSVCTNGICAPDPSGTAVTPVTTVPVTTPVTAPVNTPTTTTVKITVATTPKTSTPTVVTTRPTPTTPTTVRPVVTTTHDHPHPTPGTTATSTYPEPKTTPTVTYPQPVTTPAITYPQPTPTSPKTHPTSTATTTPAPVYPTATTTPSRVSPRPTYPPVVTTPRVTTPPVTYPTAVTTPARTYPSVVTTPRVTYPTARTTPPVTYPTAKTTPSRTYPSAVTTPRPTYPTLVTTPSVTSRPLQTTTKRRISIVSDQVPYPVSTTTTQAPITTPRFPQAYFTITVTRGQGYYSQPVKNARVTTIGQNSPLGYTQTLPGTMIVDTAYPSYPGACMVRVYDPSGLQGYASVVMFNVEVVDAEGKTCRPQCYCSQTKRYKDCPQGNRFKISSNKQLSDPIAFASSEKEALEKMWTVTTYRQRTPDYVIFQCP